MSAIDELRSMAASVGLEVPQAATLMMGAADAIDRLDAENAKLRELIHDMLPFAEAGMDNTCVTRSCCMFDKCTSEAEDKCLIEEHIAARMRELGVEAD